MQLGTKKYFITGVIAGLLTLSSGVMANADESETDTDRAVRLMNTNLADTVNKSESLRTMGRIFTTIGEVVPLAKNATVIGSVNDWAADKWEAAAYKNAGELTAAFIGAPDDALTDSHIRQTLETNPQFAQTLTVANVQTIKNIVLESRNNQEVFLQKQAQAEEILLNLSEQSREQADLIIQGQGTINQNIRAIGDDITLASETTRLAIQDSKEEIVKKSEELARLQATQVARLKAGQTEIRSDVAEAISSGRSAEQAATMAYLQSEANTAILGTHTSYLDRIDTRGVRIEGGVSFIATQKFMEIPAKERVEILKNPESPAYKAVFGSLKEADRESAVEIATDTAKAQVLKQQITDGIQLTQSIVQGVSVIGKELGWDFVESKDFQNGQKYLMAAGNLAMAYMTGNPIAGINAVTSLFAGPNTSPSPGEAEILKQLGLMDQKLDEILQNQEEIKDLIVSNHEEMRALQHATVFKIDSVLDGIDDLKIAASAIIESIDDYSDLQDSMNNCATIASLSSNPGTYKDEATFVRTNISRFTSCDAGITSLWREAPELSEDYHVKVRMMSAVKSSPNGTSRASVIEKNTHVYAPLIDLLWKHFNVETSNFDTQANHDALALISNLANPTENMSRLRSKGYDGQKFVSALIASRDSNAKKISTVKQFQDLFNPDEIIRGSEVFITMAPYRSLRDTRDTNFVILSESDLNSGDTDIPIILAQNEFARNVQINSILNAINISIAQQSLLSGDFLIPQISDIVFGSDRSLSRNKLLLAMSKNPTLATNVLNYRINEELGVARKLPERMDLSGENLLPASLNVDGFLRNRLYNLQFYDSAFRTVDESEATEDLDCSNGSNDLRCISVRELPVENSQIVLEAVRYTPGDVREVVQKYAFDMPTPKSVQDRAIRVRPEVYDLLDARERIMAYLEANDSDFIADTDGSNWAISE